MHSEGHLTADRWGHSRTAGHGAAPTLNTVPNLPKCNMT